MAIISEQGVSATSRSDYIALLNARFRAALGSDLDVSSPTPQGQLIGVLADTLSEVDQAIISQANGIGLTTATGRQLDDIASLFGLSRHSATYSTVTATLTGVTGTRIPEGSLAATTAGDVFATAAGGETGVAIGAGGTVDVAMRAQRSGAVVAAANALSRVITRIAGWDSITNAAAAVPGRAIETDASLRERYRAALGRNARTTLAAMMSAIRDLEGVTDYRVFENGAAVPSTIRGVTIGANSILAIVETNPQNAANDLLVATAILANKSLGVGTSGRESQVVRAPWGHDYTVRFSRPVNIPISVEIRVDAGADFPADGTQQLINRLTEYVNRLGIGDGIGDHSLERPAYQVPGHEITDITVERTTASTASIVSGDAPGTTATLDIPASATLTGIGGATESVTIATGTGVAVATVASQLQTALRAESFTGAGGITVTLESTGAARRFVIAVPYGVSVAAGGLTGNLAPLLGFDAASNPQYRVRGVDTADLDLDHNLTLSAANVSIASLTG